MSQTYVINGASRGIGLEFVKQIAAKGHTVFALARNPQASEGLKAFVDNKKVFAVKCDALSVESAKNAAEEVEKYAPGGIDILINNAAISGSIIHTIEDAPKAEYLEVFETNVVGISQVTNAFLPLLRKRDQDAVKKIFYISSLAGSISEIGTLNDTGKFPAYCVSKAGLNMLVKLNANRLGKENIWATSIHPGSVMTDMNPRGTITTEESVIGMLNVLDNLTLEQNGAFLDYEGKEIAW